MALSMVDCSGRPEVRHEKCSRGSPVNTEAVYSGLRARISIRRTNIRHAVNPREKLSSPCPKSRRFRQDGENQLCEAAH